MLRGRRWWASHASMLATPIHLVCAPSQPPIRIVAVAVELQDRRGRPLLERPVLSGDLLRGHVLKRPLSKQAASSDSAATPPLFVSTPPLRPLLVIYLAIEGLPTEHLQEVFKGGLPNAHHDQQAKSHHHEAQPYARAPLRTATAAFLFALLARAEIAKSVADEPVGRLLYVLALPFAYKVEVPLTAETIEGAQRSIAGARAHTLEQVIGNDSLSHVILLDRP